VPVDARASGRTSLRVSSAAIGTQLPTDVQNGRRAVAAGDVFHRRWIDLYFLYSLVRYARLVRLHAALSRGGAAGRVVAGRFRADEIPHGKQFDADARKKLVRTLSVALSFIVPVREALYAHG